MPRKGIGALIQLARLMLDSEVKGLEELNPFGMA